MIPSELLQSGQSTSIPEIKARHQEVGEQLSAAAARLVDAMNASSLSIVEFAQAWLRVRARINYRDRAWRATALFGPSWLKAHPGRRLPGSMRNRRLAKKRAQFLERWAREEGLA